MEFWGVFFFQERRMFVKCAEIESLNGINSDAKISFMLRRFFFWKCFHDNFFYDVNEN